MATREKVFAVRDYSLAATLDSGQAFRWRRENDSWLGVVGQRQVRLWQKGNFIHAELAAPCSDWRWLENYLRLDVDLRAMLKTFPDDAPLREAVAACRGLRLLRQEPWECLASFILSSTKQIVQIKQIIALLCERFGEPIAVGRTSSRAVVVMSQIVRGSRGRSPHQFPTPEKIASLTEAELRGCKMGFRAKYLLAAATAVAAGKIDLAKLEALPLAEARARLMELPGVGRKIADCVLLFSCGQDAAFPIDVWVTRALCELYFPKRKPSARRLEEFAGTHFGPHAGWAQQYLFHYVRTKLK